MTSPAVVADLLTTDPAGGFVEERAVTLVAEVPLQSDTERDKWLAIQQSPAAAGLANIQFKYADDPDEVIPAHELASLNPTHESPCRIRVHADKRRTDEWIGFFTVAGLADTLSRSSEIEAFRGIRRLRLAGLGSPIQTLLFSILPWTASDSVVTGCSDPRVQQTGDARKLVRTNELSLVPGLVGAWLCTEWPSRTESVIDQWLSVAAQQAASSLATEIWRKDGDIEFVLRGPLTRRVHGDLDALPAASRYAIIECARWVYELGPEAEVRHSLLAQELARMWPDDAPWETGLAAKTEDAAEVARVAYSLHLSETSADALRSLAELRKTLADETTKIARFSRDITTSLWRSFVLTAGAIVTNVLTIQKEDPPDLRWLGWPTAALILIAYTFETFTQRQAIGQLKESLETWRARLYSYVGDDDFKKLAREPIAKADQMYWTVWWLVLLLNVALVVVLVLLATGDIPLAATSGPPRGTPVPGASLSLR